MNKYPEDLDPTERHSADEYISDLLAKVRFLHNLLKHNEVHDHDCAVSQIARSHAMGYGAALQPCDCWLAP